MTAPAEVFAETLSRDPLELLASELQGPTSDAQLDALASELCRMLGEIRDEITRYSQARELEEARLAFRYQALLEPLEQRYARIEEIGKEVASRADFGKKKSRKDTTRRSARRRKSCYMEKFEAAAAPKDVAVTTLRAAAKRLRHDENMTRAAVADAEFFLEQQDNERAA